MSQSQPQRLTEYTLPYSLKLALLWVAVTLCYLYGDYFELYVPHKVEGLIDGKNLLNTPLRLWGAAGMLSIPALMVFLSVGLKAAISRWANIVFGVFFTAIMLLIAVTNLVPWRYFYVYLALVESVLTGLIVLYAIKWPKQSAEEAQ